MRKGESLVLLTTFLSCALAGSLWTGCDDPCSCPEQTPRPPAASGLMRLSVWAPPLADGGSSTVVAPQSGSLTVTADTVVIRYRQSGVDHEVVYAVTGPL